MCLAVPAKVMELKGENAVVDVGGSRIEANVSLLQEVNVGDYVLVHAGFAIGRYKPEEAREVLDVMEQYFDEMERDEKRRQ